MLNINSILMLVQIQQMQQLQQIFTADETQNQNSTDSATIPFADIFAALLGDTDIFQVAAAMDIDNPSLRNKSGQNSKLSQVSASDENPSSLENIFNYFASMYNLNPNLLKAVAKAESGFDPNAISQAGAQGVMQLMPQTAKSLGVEDSFDPVENIGGGAKYLSTLLNKFDGNTELAVAAYNAGPGAVKKYGGIPPYKETQNYVRKVMSNMVDYVG